jgi:fluoride exporter
VNVVYVAIGSAAGGVARWLLGGALQRRLGGPGVQAGIVPFPVGTLLVNVTGSFLLGALAIIVARQTGGSNPTRLLLMVGFCGGYTTFSTFSVDTVALLEQGTPGLAALNVVASLALAFLATFAGMLLMRALLGRA